MNSQNKFKVVKPIGGVHGISAIFPTLKDVIDYEEKIVRLNRGYPRFVTHPFVGKIEETLKNKFHAREVLCCQTFESALFLVFDFYLKKGIKIYTDYDLCHRLIAFYNKKFKNFIKTAKTLNEADLLIINRKLREKLTDFVNIPKIGIIDAEKRELYEKFNGMDVLVFNYKEKDIGAIIFYTDIFSEINLLRRHSGFIANSRKLCPTRAFTRAQFKKHETCLKNKLGELEKVSGNDCFLFPSGMAAIFCTILSLFARNKNKIIALGSLYVDTLRILEKWPKKFGFKNNIIIYHNFENELLKVIDDSIAGIIFEIPSNPLIQVIDVEKIVSIAQQKKIPIVIDNTIATPYNFNPFDFNVDIIVHSTTKFLSGKNNHMGGCILVKNEKLKKKLNDFKNFLNLNMTFDDIKILNRNIKKFENRMKTINDNAFKVAKFLQNYETIDKVYYPFLESSSDYLLAKKYLKGGSGLLSFVFKNSSISNATYFYDNIKSPILKGPSLGSEKTLLSPYVIMAHYNDSKEKLLKLGYDFCLMRLSIGTERTEKIIDCLKYALERTK